MIPSDKLDDPYFSDEFVSKSPWYGPVFYHDKAEVYTRVAVHAGEDRYKRSSSVIIFDSQFNVVGEHFFDKQDNYSVIFDYPIPTPEGMLVALRNELQSEDQWVYQGLFKIVRQ
jgi:hypothetical protein